MTALRFNEGKPELDYLATWYDALCEVVKVCMANSEDHGGKYPTGNYLLGQSDRQLLQCAYRHAMKAGSPHYDDIDPDDGCLHAAKAVWNLLQYLQNQALRERGVAIGVADGLRVPSC